jgi:hypothetical protein
MHTVHVAANETAGGQRQLTPLDALDRVKPGGNALLEAVIENQPAFVANRPLPCSWMKAVSNIENLRLATSDA